MKGAASSRLDRGGWVEIRGGGCDSSSTEYRCEAPSIELSAPTDLATLDVELRDGTGSWRMLVRHDRPDTRAVFDAASLPLMPGARATVSFVPFPEDVEDASFRFLLGCDEQPVLDVRRNGESFSLLVPALRPCPARTAPASDAAIEGGMDAGADDAGDAGDEHDAGPSVDAGTSAGSAREPDTVKLWATFPKGATPIVLACEGPRACNGGPRHERDDHGRSVVRRLGVRANERATARSTLPALQRQTEQHDPALPLSSMPART
jgi:hypothetical protein